MQPDRWIRVALGIAVAAAVIAALAVVGGPRAGRMERRDAARLNDLQALAEFVQCAAETQGALPPALPPDSVCPRGLRRSDPWTGAPYRYERVSPSAFRLCAGFEAPARLGRWAGVDPATGCMQSVRQVSGPQPERLETRPAGDHLNGTEKE